MIIAHLCLIWVPSQPVVKRDEKTPMKELPRRNKTRIAQKQIEMMQIMYEEWLENYSEPCKS